MWPPADPARVLPPRPMHESRMKETSIGAERRERLASAEPARRSAFGAAASSGQGRYRHGLFKEFAPCHAVVAARLSGVLAFPGPSDRRRNLRGYSFT